MWELSHNLVKNPKLLTLYLGTRSLLDELHSLKKAYYIEGELGSNNGPRQLLIMESLRWN